MLDRLVLLGSILFVLAAPVALAEDTDEDPPEVETRVQTLLVDGNQERIEVADLPTGRWVALTPLVERLGGELEVGPLGHRHVLTLGGVQSIFGPDSPSLMVGEDVFTLQRTPISGPAGLLVPVELLQYTWGELLGYDFRWDSQRGALIVVRRAIRELAVTVETVHIMGVTTLVVTFEEEPNYRILQSRQALEIEVVRDRLRGGVAPFPEGSLVDGARIGDQAISIRLARGTSASDYTLENPFRLVFDVHRSEQRRVNPQTFPPPAAVPSREPGVPTIVIDPGHGGEETGAIGRDGVVEKELTLVLARQLRRKLVDRLPMRVVLTRESDMALPLDSRTALANQHQAELFISLHLNWAPGTHTAGAETYFLSLQASDDEAAELAEQENLGPGSRIDDSSALRDLELILWDLAQSHHLAESQRFAKLVQEELNLALGLRNRGVKQAPFRVLKGAAMPAVLVELGFLSNPEEEIRLQSAEYQEQLVDAVVRAVVRYRAQRDGVDLSADQARR